MTKTYKSTGVVLGNYWGGGSGSYAARRFSGSTKEEIIDLNKKAFENGSLDSGMGYESLIGGLIEITTTTTIVVDGKEFTNDETEFITVGNLNDSQYEFLEEVFYHI